jgi:hypothetical protein
MPAVFHGKRLVLVLITVLCLAVAVLYTLFFARGSWPSGDRTASLEKPSTSSGPAVSQARKIPQDISPGPVSDTAAEGAREPSHSRARLIALNMRNSPNLGKVEYAPLDQVEEAHRTPTDLRCERIYFAANQGICLEREIHLFSAQTVAILLDGTFRPRFTLRTDGIPSRARISPDGRYAAFTVFLTGHSYADAQLSTATLLLNMDQGTTIANLEEFQVWKDGKLITAPDFNYWGVTFESDSNFFYATLRTGGTTYLVHGDIRARSNSVVYQGVECPALSPDGTRLAFKKLVSSNHWRLTVLDLSSLREIPLAETRSVDDQAEWLDNHHVLYAIVDDAPWMSIMVVPSDGTGRPQIFARGAACPVVAR